MTSKTERLLDTIVARGASRTSDLARATGIPAKNVAAFLNPRVAAGELVVCKVQRPGMKDENEYRIAASGKAAPWNPSVPRRAWRPLKTEETRGAPPAPEAPSSRAGRTVGAIERGIPIPVKKRGRGSALQDALNALQPGDSFATTHSAAGVRNAARLVRVKITMRAVEDGVRVWRLA